MALPSLDSWTAPGHDREIDSHENGPPDIPWRRWEPRRTLKPVSVLDRWPDEVLSHPRHLAAQPVLADLIQQLRDCANVKDGYEFQQALLSHLNAADTARAAFAQAVKRMRRGKSPQRSAPYPQSGLDPSRLETWQLERDVCERVVRQFKCVGDALAWRVFGFQRKHIIALCQNPSPGAFADKIGRAAELARVEQAYSEDGKFAILHDLTNCLRIGDVTIFDNDGAFKTIEIKTNPCHTNPAQKRQVKAAAAAVVDNAPLPGKDARARLYDIDLPYETHLDALRLGTERAARDGIFTAKLPGDRALLVTDIYGYTAGGWTDNEWPDAVGRKFISALRRAGIGDGRQWHVTATSLDSVSRDPARVPFAAYPLHPVACARIIGDYAIFHVETSGPSLADSLRCLGIDARWVLPPAQEYRELQPGEVVMEMITSSVVPTAGHFTRALGSGIRMELSRALQMQRSELDRYLIELLDQATWIEGIRYLLADHQFGNGRPWPHYRGEEKIWV